VAGVFQSQRRRLFFFPVRSQSKPRVLNESTVNEIACLHPSGKNKTEICEELGIRKNTLDKALSQNRIILPPLPESVSEVESTGSSRNALDSEWLMGKSCSNETSRVLAARCGVPCRPTFGKHLDLSHGGLLLTLPSLLACGLWNHKEVFELSGVYYSTEQVFMSLALLILLRVKNLEQSDRVPVGELGKCIGLDRIPEVKTLRERIATFCEAGDVEEWAGKLSREWMREEETPDGVLYVDGHVNLYYGSQTQMPKRFVSRMRLSLSGSTDYWINDRTGQPTAIITTNYALSLVQIAFFMFARWRQENFFKYMVESFGIEDIVSYMKKIVPDTSRIVNPQYRS
jgi:hypothetical protein